METLESIRNLYPPAERSRLDIVKIRGDASNRQYFRVKGGHETAIACIDPVFRSTEPETYPFLIVRQLFAVNGIRVPGLKGLDAANGLLLLEDCGDRMLQDEVPTLDAGSLSDRYRQIIDILVRIQSIRPGGKPSASEIPFSLCFDPEKLMFEFDFFIQHGLRGYFRGAIDDRAIMQLREEFIAIANLLMRPEHFVLNHRDFHSRNIMLFRNEPVIIDFQDARLGLPQYDAVSLLRDSYVRLDPSLVEALRRYHFEQLRLNGLTSMDFVEYLRLFELMAFQRNVKAIGTFCYQTTVIGNATFESSIEPTLGYLRDSIAARPELAVAGRLLDPLIPREQQ